MEFKVTRTSAMGQGKKETIEINTLEELIEFVKKADESVIISTFPENKLEIYDDYIE